MLILKVFWRILLWIPRLILRLIWQVLQALALTALLLLALYYLVTHYPSLNLLQPLEQGALQLGNLISRQIGAANPDLPQQLEELVTDHYQPTGSAKWPSNRASVYIETSEPQLVSAYQEALASWNATGVFQFELTEDRDQADIIAQDYSDANSQAAGLAESQYNALTNHFVRVSVRLNRHYLLNPDFGYDYDRIVHTAEHELGHAIGLDHTDEPSVMQPSGSHYGIQPADIEAVRQLYAP